VFQATLLDQRWTTYRSSRSISMFGGVWAITPLTPFASAGAPRKRRRSQPRCRFGLYLALGLVGHLT
jgi:hypothetical protein